MSRPQSQAAVESAGWSLMADQYSLPAGYYPIATIANFTHKVFNLDSDTIIVGRDPSACAVLLPGSRISRQHALIHVLKEGLMVRDLDSVNGTFVNGERIDESFVGPGDVLAFDRVTLKVLSPHQDSDDLTNLYLKPVHRPSQAEHTRLAAPAVADAKKSKTHFLSRIDSDVAMVLTAAVCFLLGLSIALFI